MPRFLKISVQIIVCPDVAEQIQMWHVQAIGHGVGQTFKPQWFGFE